MNVLRRNFRAIAAAVCAATWLAAPLLADDKPAHPNLVYVLVDQWRAQATGFGGDPNAKTPNLDRLAAESVRFQNAVSVCPVCTPYRAALMTGRYPTTTGMFLNDLYLPDDEFCVAEALKRAGYQTAYIGKWHLDGHGRGSFVPPERRQGFDYWKAAECDHNYNHSHYYAGDSPEKRFWEGYDAYAETRDAEQYIREHAAGGPFALFVSYGVPHFPHATAPQELRDQYPPESIRLPPNVPDDKAVKARQEASGYYAHCAAVDRCLGDLLATIDKAGIAERTIVVFTSDHGEMMGSHGCPPCQKQTPWDESTHVPLLVRYPAVHGPNGRAVATPIVTPDLMPTLLGLAGVPIPDTVEGEDLSGLVRGEAEPHDRGVLFMNVSPFADYHQGKEYRGIRTARYTFVRDLDGPWLLYDNQSDPHQLNNLVNRPECAAVQKDLDERLHALLRKVGDDFRPRREYLDKWHYEVDRAGCIPYTGQHKLQTPKPSNAAKR